MCMYAVVGPARSHSNCDLAGESTQRALGAPGSRRLGGDRTPSPMAAPAYYDHRQAESSAAEVVEAILGATAGEDDADELAKVAALQGCLRAARCREAADLLVLQLTEWNTHVREAGWEQNYVSGVVRCLLKYLGSRGVPHVPPAATGVACECRLRIAPTTTKSCTLTDGCWARVSHAPSVSALWSAQTLRARGCCRRRRRPLQPELPPQQLHPSHTPYLAMGAVGGVAMPQTSPLP